MKRPTSRTLSPGVWTLVILLAALALWEGAARRLSLIHI